MADTSKKDAGVVVFGNVLREEAYSRSGGTVDAIDSKWVSGFVTCASPMSPKLARPIAALLSLVALPVRFVVLALRYLLAAKHGVIFVPFPAHVDGALAILLGSLFGKRVVLDFLYSLYDTVVVDRKLLSANSMLAILLFWYERRLLRHACLVLLDTQEHTKYVRELYEDSPARLGVIPVSIDEQLWSEIASRPIDSANTVEPFRVLLWSTFIPLHGVDVLVRAAKRLESFPITIEIIGTGQTATAIRRLIQALDVTNIEWDDRFRSPDRLRERVRHASVCLGVFSTNPKADRVIPYKIYQALCAGKPVITARTTATAGILADRDAVLFCRAGDPDSLASAIIEIYSNRELRTHIAQRGRQAYEQHLSHKALQRQLNQQLQVLCDAQ